MGMVVVHPRVYPLITASGAVRVITNDAVLRRPSGDPQSGFQSLREYQYGDDTRLIHWPTSARAATLMIREFVDLRRHEFTVVIDTSTEVATPDDFEEIVDAGASVAAFALRSGLDVVVRSTSRVRAGRPYALVDQSEMLDLLTPLEQGSGTDVLSVASLFTGGLGGVAVLVVTGPKGPSSIFSHGDQISVGQGRRRCRDGRSFVPCDRGTRCGPVRRAVGAMELGPGSRNDQRTSLRFVLLSCHGLRCRSCTQFGPGCGDTIRTGPADPCGFSRTGSNRVPTTRAALSADRHRRPAPREHARMRRPLSCWKQALVPLRPPLCELAVLGRDRRARKTAVRRHPTLATLIWSPCEKIDDGPFGPGDHQTATPPSPPVNKLATDKTSVPLPCSSGVSRSSISD